MKIARIKLESEIDFIPTYKRRKKVKYFEFKILFIRIITEGLF